jgi:hypothetical protein
MKKSKVDFEQDDHVQTTSFAWKKLLKNATNQEIRLLFVDLTKGYDSIPVS